MSRKFTPVSPALWRSPRVMELGDASRVLLFYVLTCRHQNNTGCFMLPPAYAMADLQWPPERFDAAFDALVEAGLIMTDKTTDEIYVTGWFRHCAPFNIKHATGVIANIYSIESDALREQVETDFGETEFGKKTRTKA